MTYRNFIDFLLVPTVVYEPEYPRTEKVRILYVIEKFFAFAGLWTVLVSPFSSKSLRIF